MFEALSDQLRSARAPLTYGYSVLLGAWIGLRGKPPSWLQSDAAFGPLDELSQKMSAGARFAVGAVLAFAIGVVLEHAILGRVTQAVSDRIAGSSWDSYIAEAEKRATRYGEAGGGFTILEFQQDRNPAPRVSAGREAQLWAEVDQRRGEEASFTYRIVILLATVPVVAGCVAGGSRLWLAAIPIAFALFLELRYFDRLVVRRLAAVEIRAKREEFEQAKKTVRRLQEKGESASWNKESFPQEFDSQVLRVEQLESELRELESNPRGYFRTQVRDT